MAFAGSLITGGCHRSNAPSNHSPVFISTTVFPADIAVTDSAIVTCDATDQDGDSLYYDWTTDGRLAIQGVPSYFHALYDSRIPWHVFYPAAVDSPVDSAIIVCAVRDHRGGYAEVGVRLRVHH